jgi:hypothetical protein
MESMEQIDRLFKAKEERRATLAGMPCPEKVRAVVRMQQMVYPLVRKRNPRACVWRIPGMETAKNPSSPDQPGDPPDPTLPAACRARQHHARRVQPPASSAG